MDSRRRVELFDRIVQADFGRGDTEARARLRSHLAGDAEASTVAAETEAVWALLGTLDRPDEDAAAIAPPSPGVMERLRGGWGMALAACLLLAITLSWIAWMPGSGPETYAIATGPGERRIARLDDGSTVELSAGSRVAVQYDGKARRISLTRGEALFRVAHEEDRPFLVDAGGGEIMAVGTAFNVKLGRQDVVVTVVEGTVRVAIEPDKRADRSRRGLAELAHRGEQVSYESRPVGSTRPVAATLAPARPVDVARETAWTRGLLEFHGEPLAQVVAELNRHGRRHIVLLDDRVARTRIYGLLGIDDPDGLIALLNGSEALRGQRVETLVRIEDRDDR